MKVCLLGDANSIHLQRIASGLAAHGVDVHVLCRKPAAIDGVTVERFEVPPFGPAYPMRWHARSRRLLRNLLRRFDVVNVHFLHDWGFEPEMLGEGCFVASPWGSDITPPPGEQPPAGEAVARRVALLQAAALVTTCGPSFARTVARFAAIDAEDIVVLPIGVDLDLFRPPLPADRPVAAGHKVGFFKGFRPVYGAVELLRAIPAILAVFPETRFHLLGDGADLERCRQLAAFYDVAHAIRWVRRQPYANMPNHLAGWDVVAIPSICESFGVAALEASAMGIAVVASDVGGLPDTVVDGETGLLVPPADPEALADAIVRLLSDDPLRRRMGLAGRKFVEQYYNWQRILDQWVVTYEMARDRGGVMV